jgi:tRNA nucleotidyltransferase/poly(A) polymerase
VNDYNNVNLEEILKKAFEGDFLNQFCVYEYLVKKKNVKKFKKFNERYKKYLSKDYKGVNTDYLEKIKIIDEKIIKLNHYLYNEQDNLKRLSIYKNEVLSLIENLNPKKIKIWSNYFNEVEKNYLE